MTALAVALVTSSIAASLVAWLTTRRFRLAIALMLDLWVAAGLLRLSQESSWQRIAAAAAVIAVRKLVVYALDKGPDPLGRRHFASKPSSE